MVSDSIAAFPIPSAANTKNPGKKKRISRSAKLKQYKIDARREQWLSQGAVKKKGCKDGLDDGVHVLSSPVGKQSKHELEKVEMRRRGGEVDVLIHQDSDLESPSNSPVSSNSSVFCGKELEEARILSETVVEGFLGEIGIRRNWNYLSRFTGFSRAGSILLQAHAYDPC